MKKIFILGLNSFSGSYFANHASQKGYKVFGCYRTEKRNLLLPYDKNSIKRYKIDFNKKNDVIKTIKILNKIKPDFLIDFASICHVNESWKYPEKYFKINVLSKILLFKNNFKFLKKVIYISTPEVFGNQKKLLKENSNNFIPSTPYALSKLTAETFLKSKMNNKELPLIICRFSNFYGVGQPMYRLIPKIIYCLNKKIKFPVDGNGESKRNYIHGDDFSDGILKVINKGEIGNTYHFASKSLHSVTDIIKLICNFKNFNFKKFVVFKKDRKSKDFIYKLDTKNSITKLKWRQKSNFKKSIIDIINFYDKIYKDIKNKDFKKFI